MQKIINADPERLHTSKNAAFAIALATEMFIQHLATTTHNVVKAERKPRRNLQYRDVSSAVAKTDNLEFLVDVVPKTMTYKEFKKRQEATKQEKAKTAAEQGSIQAAFAGPSGSGVKPVVNGAEARAEEQTRNGAPRESHVSQEDKTQEDVEAMDVDDSKEEARHDQREREESEPEEDGAAMQIEMEMRGPRTNGSPEVRRPSGFTAINGTR